MSAPSASEQSPAPDTVIGERSTSSVNQARSLQSRVSNVLAMGLMSTLGLGLLGWYYARTFTHQTDVKRAAQNASRNQAAGEMALPSLGKIDPPALAVTQVLGPAPTPPPADADLNATASPSPLPPGAYPSAAPPPPKSPGELALERRLARPVSLGPQVAQDPSNTPPAAPDSRASTTQEEAGSSLSHSGLSSLLKASATPADRARVLPAARLLLPKGAFIDCTLETAIDSTLPGMTTCITATDTFSVDGKVVLLERGTKLVGETRGEVQQGSARVFVLWTEARAPTGVVVPLSSPGTDELGRSGLPGDVNRHFWDRFGAAILMTVINGAVQGAVNSQNKSGSVSISPSTSTDVMGEVLRSTVSIPPTVTKAQGDRIQVFVARDVDFRPVYALRVV